MTNRLSTLRKSLAAMLAASLAIGAAPALAATATASVNVTATVISSCIASGTSLNFGSAIDPTSASVPLDTTATLTVQCTSTTPYSVALNAGTNAGGNANFTARSVRNGIKTLGYQLYTDSLRAVVWGDGTNLTAPVVGLGTGSNQSLTIYGRLPSLTGAAPGTYTDTVTVTVTY